MMAVNEPDETILLLYHAVYRMDAVKKAAYKFGGRCYVGIESSEEGARVTLRLKQPGDDLGQLAGDFLNEALDQELRELIAAETGSVRNLLLAQAFSATSLIDPNGEAADYKADPLGIAEPDDA